MFQVSVYGGRSGQASFTTLDDLILLSQELFTRLRQMSQYKHPLAVRRGVRRMEKISKTVRAGAITYFVDIKETKDKKPYLLITESRYKGEPNQRERKTIAIFQEHAKEFVQAITELTARLS
jgi:hypothetical protein